MEGMFGPIGVFDSGYGGLTILRDIVRELPEYDYVYLGDNARTPYGTRSFEVVYEYTREAVARLFEMGCRLVILACNTASAKALRTIQQRDLPGWDASRRVLGVIRPSAEAVADYDLYYRICNGKVDDNFYYFREQAKFRMDDLEGALQDIRQAMALAPDNAMYPAEEASIYIRQKKYPEALQSIDKALAIAPEFAACYRLRGVCLQRSGKPEEARIALEKAQELGDPAAAKLLQQ